MKIKVFCPKDKQSELDNLLNIQASYDSFVVGEADNQQIEQIKRRYPVVDISSNYTTINLKNQIVDTSKPRFTEKASILSHPSYDTPKKIKKGLHHYMVQFVAPVKQQWLNEIKKIGGILCEPFPTASYIVEMDEKVLAKILNLKYVSWVGHYDPKFRISSDVLARAKVPSKIKDPKKTLAKIDTTYSITPTTKKGIDTVTTSTTLPSSIEEVPTIPYKYSITFFTKKNMQQAKALLNRSGVKIVSESPNVNKVVVDIKKAAIKKDPADILTKLSEIHGIKNIEDVKIRKLFNNVAVGVMGANDVGNTLGLTGKGEVIGIADTGLDSGDPSTIHPDFRGRIKNIMSYPIDSIYNSSVNNPGANDGPKDEDSGHGTHVTGSVLGNGSSSIAAGNDIVIRGISYEAQLVFQAIEQWMDWTDEARLEWKRLGRPAPEFGLFGLPSDISELFDYSYRKGSRIHTNSWGGGMPGEYDDQCHELDNFIWNHKDFAILFAAGNDGKDSNGDGKIDIGSVTPPGTAKNCITVGASENQRPEWISQTYGGSWPQKFPSPPIQADPMSDSSTDVAAFSSRGPTADRRIKPDIVAPGTFILSTRSRYIAENHFGWGKFPPNKDYFFDSGTSMATPLSAGAAAAIRQFLRTKTRISIPSAALIKATIIHGAKKTNYRYAAEVTERLYDLEQGWGLVNVRESVSPASGKTLYVDSSDALRTGESSVLDIELNDSNIPLKVTMVYTDYPGTSLINNLNLIVTDPTGKRYHGNVFAEPFDSNLDASNNVESVFIQNPPKGKYKVEVIGANVVEGRQDFALVCSGNIV